jgi:hypothetical protein
VAGLRSLRLALLPEANTDRLVSGQLDGGALLRVRGTDRRPVRQESQRHRFARVVLKRKPHTEQVLGHTLTRWPSTQTKLEGEPSKLFLMLVI